MATWDAGQKRFTCSNCGQQYIAHYHDWPQREEGQFVCTCGTVVHSWRSTRDYTDWEAITE
jgi:hypothetical protein